MRRSIRKVPLLGLLAGICTLATEPSARGQQLILGRRLPQPSARPTTQLPVPVLDRIKIDEKPEARGDGLKLRHELAEQFSRQSFDLQERRREYAWIAPRPADGRMGFWLSGWTGSIETMTKTDNGWLVRVAVWPCIANGGHPVRRVVDGLYLEEYVYHEGRLAFQRAIAPKYPGRPLCVTW